MTDCKKTYINTYNIYKRTKQLEKLNKLELQLQVTKEKKTLVFLMLLVVNFDSGPQPEEILRNLALLLGLRLAYYLFLKVQLRSQQ